MDPVLELQPLERRRLHAGDVGARIVLPFVELDAAGHAQPLDISAAELRFVFTRPRSSEPVVVHDVVHADADAGGAGDGTDGKAMFVTTAGFLRPGGFWRLQGEAQIGSDTHRTERIEFEVGESDFPTEEFALAVGGVLLSIVPGPP